MLAMRRQIPQKERPFRLPYIEIFAYFGFLAANLIVYWAGWPTVWKMMIGVLIGYVVLIIHEAVRKDENPDMEFRSGMWVVFWLIGMTLFSWLGSYPKVGKHAGNLGVIGVGWGVLVFAVFAALITWIAMKYRLPAEKVQAHLKEPVPDEETPFEGEI